MAALELRKGLENASLYLYENFPQNKKKSGFLAEYVGYYQNFPQNTKKIPKLSAKILKTGLLTCDFLADVEG